MKLKLLPIWRLKFRSKVGQIKKDSQCFSVSCRVVLLELVSCSIIHHPSISTIIPFGSSFSSKTIFRISENRFKFVSNVNHFGLKCPVVKQVKFCLMISYIYQLHVLQIGSQSKANFSEINCGVTEMGNDWNYRFGGQMQNHWERFTSIWVHDRGDRRMVDGITRDKVRKELALRIQNGSSWLHGMTRRNVASLS